VSTDHCGLKHEFYFDNTWFLSTGDFAVELDSIVARPGTYSGTAEASRSCFEANRELCLYILRTETLHRVLRVELTTACALTSAAVLVHLGLTEWLTEVGGIVYKPVLRLVLSILCLESLIFMS
jgi:hypothetical protein